MHVTDLVHARQFLAATRPFVTSTLGRQEAFAGILIALHTLATWTRASHANRELFALGHVLSPGSPELDASGVLARLAKQSVSFEAFEAAIAELAGRWLLFVRIGPSTRLYTDAAGLKSAFYLKQGGDLWIGSQPGLMAEQNAVRPIRDPLEELRCSPHADVWPGGATPYEGVRQLLPNHYLDVASGEAHRYWPRADVERVDLDTAALSISNHLKGSIQAIWNRGGGVAVPLTGGFDSRSILASSWCVKDDIQSFTVVDAATGFHDAWLPRRMASRFGLNHEFHWAKHSAGRELELIRLNTGRIWRDPNEHRLPAFGKSKSRFTLMGSASEIIRSGFFEDGRYPEQVTPELLAKVAGWDDNAAVTKTCAEWLSGVPRSNVRTFDLFYWECRVGGWSSLDCTAMDAYTEVIPPYNSRRLLETGLGVEARHLFGDCALHRRVCELGAPETLEFPFNRTWLSGVQGNFRRWLPARLHKMIRRARKRLSGTDDVR